MLEDRRPDTDEFRAVTHFSWAGVTTPVCVRAMSLREVGCLALVHTAGLEGGRAGVRARPDSVGPRSNHDCPISAWGPLAWPGRRSYKPHAAITGENGHRVLGLGRPSLGFPRRPACWVVAGGAEAGSSLHRAALLHAPLQTASTGKGTSEHN